MDIRWQFLCFAFSLSTMCVRVFEESPWNVFGNQTSLTFPSSFGSKVFVGFIPSVPSSLFLKLENEPGAFPGF